MVACRQKECRNFQIGIEFEGKTYQANYSFGSGVVTVNSWYGSASTPVGEMKVKQVARTLFRELLQAEFDAWNERRIASLAGENQGAKTWRGKR
jgi:hypothetical protein